MGTSKAFVFSLDAFVAFVLTVAALYSLMFFATVPAAYYSSLMQANYLAKDTLLTLATTTLSEDDSATSCMEGQTYLACVISDSELGISDNDADDDAARIYIGSEGPEGIYDESALVPAQFGYKIEIIEFDEIDGEINFSEADWELVYDTANDSNSANKKEYNKLKAAAHALSFGYEDEPAGGEEAPLHYMTCGGEYTICSWPPPFVYYENYDHPSNLAIAGDAYAYVVRFTVYT